MEPETTIGTLTKLTAEFLLKLREAGVDNALVLASWTEPKDDISKEDTLFFDCDMGNNFAVRQQATDWLKTKDSTHTYADDLETSQDTPSIFPLN